MAPTCLLPATHVSTSITIDPTRESRHCPAPLQPRHLAATAPPSTRVPTACAELHESEAEARANMHAMRRQVEVLHGERLAGAEEANLARADAASAVSAARAELREEFDRGARQATSGRAEEVATARAEAAAASEAGAEERWAVREAALRAEETAARARLETALAAARAEAAGVRASRQELEGAQFAARAAAAMATERAREVRAALSMAREQHEARSRLQELVASLRAQLVTSAATAEAHFWDARAERGLVAAGSEERSEIRDELETTRHAAGLAHAGLLEAHHEMRALRAVATSAANAQKGRELAAKSIRAANTAPCGLDELLLQASRAKVGPRGRGQGASFEAAWP